VRGWEGNAHLSNCYADASNSSISFESSVTSLRPSSPEGFATPMTLNNAVCCCACARAVPGDRPSVSNCLVMIGPLTVPSDLSSVRAERVYLLSFLPTSIAATAFFTFSATFFALSAFWLAVNFCCVSAATSQKLRAGASVLVVASTFALSTFGVDLVSAAATAAVFVSSGVDAAAVDFVCATVLVVDFAEVEDALVFVVGFVARFAIVFVLRFIVA